MRILAAAVSFLFAVGCATPERVKLDPVAGTPANSAFRFVDARPAPPAGDHTPVSPWRDEQFDPKPPVLVERALRRSNALLEGRSVALKEFTVVFIRREVQQSPMAAHNAFMYGAIGAGVTAMLDAANSPDRCRARIVIEVDSVPVAATAFEDVSKYAGESGIASVIELALDRLTEALQGTQARESIVKTGAQP